MLCLNFNSKLTPKGREQDSRIHGKADVLKNTKMFSSCTWLQKKKKQVHMRTVTECKGLHLPTYLILMCKFVCTYMPMNDSVNSAAHCTLYSRNTPNGGTCNARTHTVTLELLLLETSASNANTPSEHAPHAITEFFIQ